MGKLIDLTGQKFGRWTVLYHANKKNSKGEKIYWHCKCECGNEKDVDGYELRRGGSKSCGCLNREKVQEACTKDLVGQTFGKLTVIKKTDKRSGGHVVWLCKCNCGNEIEVDGASLRSGNTKSCGCLISENLIGQKFGRLTVIEKTDKRTSDRLIKWKCQCDCGNICEVPSRNLKNGHTQSCGCLKSKGELKITQILKNNNIFFEKQKTFEDCKFEDTNYLAKFDFYINNQYIIEYDGSQHFKIGGWNTQENFTKVKEHDEIKNQYCKEHNIPLIRIPYTHLNELCLEDLLLETSQFIVN